MRVCSWRPCVYPAQGVVRNGTAPMDGLDHCRAHAACVNPRVLLTSSLSPARKWACRPPRVPTAAMVQTAYTHSCGRNYIKFPRVAKVGGACILPGGERISRWLEVT